MANQPNEPPPPVQAIDSFLRSVIRVFEVQLGISYPLQSINDSQEVMSYPILREITKLLIALAEQLNPDGNYIADVLRRWLRLNNQPAMNGLNIVDMLRSRTLLKILYSRGIANNFPPQLALEPITQELTYINHLRRVTELEIQGEDRKNMLLTTHAVHHATISAGFCIADAYYGTKHTLKIITESPRHYFRVQFPNRASNLHLQPLRILIINAAGAKNPEFIYTFAELTFEHNPHLVIITETRIGGNEGAAARNSMNYTASASLEPIGFFGGAWFLWNSGSLNFEYVTMHAQSTTFQICFPH